jgi:hydrogenase/urease accessory protein HupE
MNRASARRDRANRPRLTVGATIALVALLATMTVEAHEIGTTRVDAAFHPDGRYEIALTADSETLLGRLELAAGGSRSPAVPPQARLHAIETLAPTLLNQMFVRFDGVRVKPELVRSVLLPGTDPSAIPVTVTFGGAIPPRARTFTWGYELTYGSYSLTLHNETDNNLTRQWLEGEQQSAPFVLRERAAPLSRLQIARLYLRLGFTHIVPDGVDHILFVLGIFLLSTRLRDILSQVTAFTVAHSITLALTMYGLVSLPSRVVEPMIALSIAYVAIENLFTSRVHSWRVALVFCFGLLHGMGFAGVLRELGLPRSEFATALITFNVGVELGQLTVIAAAWLLVASWARNKSWYRTRLVTSMSCVIAAVGLYWTVQRVML